MLNVIAQANQVKKNINHITIDYDELNKLADTIIEENLEFKPSTLLKSELSLEDYLQKILIFNTQTFCFWAEKDKPKWTVNNTDGSVALAYCIDKELEKNHNFLSAEYLCEIDQESVEQIFKGNVQIPMLYERVQLLNEIGQVLSKDYDGKYINMVEQASYDAQKLLQILVDKIKGFDDISSYKGIPIGFYKRAQLQVKMTNDLLLIFNKKPLANMETLTAIADYKIPQILREMNILKYTLELANLVDTQTLIEKDSEIENEIRLCNVIAIDYLQEKLRERGVNLYATDIDAVLWMKSQTLAKPKPYHRVYTIAY